MSRGTGGFVPLRRSLFPYWLNLPAIIVVLTLIAYPIGLSFWISLHRINFRRPNAATFVGLDNYIAALTSEEFTSALSVTFRFAAATVTLILVVSLALALLLNLPVKGRGLLRALVLVPWAIPPVVNATLWQLIFDSHVGAFNGLLLELGLIERYEAWLVDPDTAMLVIVLAHAWNHVPLATIIFLAALQAIPQDLYEAALIDRATRLRAFLTITMPWLLRPILIVMILQTMGALRAFDLFYVLTGGGPGTSTTTIAWLTYKKTFVFLDVGMGSTYSYILMILTLGLALVYIRSLYRRGDVE